MKETMKKKTRAKEMQNDDEGGGGLRQFFPSSHSVLSPVLHPFHPLSSFHPFSLSSFHHFFPFIPSFLCSLQFSRVKEENYVSVMSWGRENQRVKKERQTLPLSLFLSLDFWYKERMRERREKERRTELKGEKNKLREIEQKVVTLFSCCKKILPLDPLLLYFFPALLQRRNKVKDRGREVERKREKEFGSLLLIFPTH